VLSERKARFAFLLKYLTEIALELYYVGQSAPEGSLIGSFRFSRTLMDVACLPN